LGHNEPSSYGGSSNNIGDDGGVGKEQNVQSKQSAFRHVLSSDLLSTSHHQSQGKGGGEGVGEGVEDVCEDEQ